MSRLGKNVLFVDDDADVRKTAELLLKKRGYGFFGADSPESALSWLEANPIDVILLDLNFSKGQTTGAEGLACLRDILRYDPTAMVIVVTGHSGLSIAVQALKAGAHDFIMKPWNNDRLVEAIEAAVQVRKTTTDSGRETALFLGNSPSVQLIRATVDRCASLTAPILIRGETGAGKSLLASTIHCQSGREHLMPVDASVFEPSTIPAQRNMTLLLENIDRLPPAQTAALMLWSANAGRENNRLISTTSLSGRDIGIDRGLYYAISTIEIELPPLRARRDDIVPLAEHFMRVACQRQGLAVKSFSADAQSHMRASHWADNIHALRQVVERVAILVDSPEIGVADLGHTDQAATVFTQAPSLADTEKSLIEAALQRHNFNISAAAEALGLSRPSLYRRMSKHGL
ncbi:sigma-54-dependent transcriptional regulator [Asticcacaulis machinosus]|uniref:Response regulator n=1 Tax=Asticcacaulis machinosus TaxID=2984211 RepID=A0ABT5HIT0_9CAUL|nr:response regulator [Asticcacaulis machinosus]MDC7676145.1 response regulator [Asticcacaulis machinosus]